jgi:hypothetical protein
MLALRARLMAEIFPGQAGARQSLAVLVRRPGLSMPRGGS